MGLIKVNQSRCIKYGIYAKGCPRGVLFMGGNGLRAIEPRALQ